jgi:hypothetical protein
MENRKIVKIKRTKTATATKDDSSNLEEEHVILRNKYIKEMIVKKEKEMDQEDTNLIFATLMVQNQLKSQEKHQQSLDMLSFQKECLELKGAKQRLAQEK